ncbi:hypothetical protein ABBQ38_001834 [Trebouxia sp. C0009 RCD-2024]
MLHTACSGGLLPSARKQGQPSTLQAARLHSYKLHTSRLLSRAGHLQCHSSAVTPSQPDSRPPGSPDISLLSMELQQEWHVNRNMPWEQSSNRRLCLHNSLATIAPDVAHYWDLTKNDKSAEQVLASSYVRAEWKCPACNLVQQEGLVVECKAWQLEAGCECSYLAVTVTTGQHLSKVCCTSLYLLSPYGVASGRMSGPAGGQCFISIASARGS